MKLDLANKATSEYTVAEMFKCWKDKDFKRANKYIQKTWLKSSGKDGFKKMFGYLELIDFYIYDKEIITDCREEVDFKAVILWKGKEVNMYGKANTIRETAPYEPNPKGKWGVNPISLHRWIKQK